MIKVPVSNTRGFLVALVLSLFVLLDTPSSADSGGMNELMETYNQARDILDDPAAAQPFYLEVNIDGRKQVGVAAIYFDQPFEEIADSLSDLANWCDVLLLHLNTKACTYNKKDGRGELTVYFGRKFYQDPDDAFVMTYVFETKRSPNYFSALITAEEGPLGTSDYRIQLEVTTISNRTFGRIQVAQTHSWLSSRAAKLYVATVGSGKQGISIVGHDTNGDPLFSEGEQAIAERNLLRYYFAFTSFFRFRSEESEQRFGDSLNYWFDQTELYKQLYEVDRTQYLQDKNKELQNQIALQDSEYVDKQSLKNR